MIKIYLAQWDADRFLRSQYNGISESSLIQFNEGTTPCHSGEISWFCKAGGEKIICAEKGTSKTLVGKTDFRVIQKNSTFLYQGKLLNYGNKGIISQPKIIKSSLQLRRAYGENRCKEHRLKDLFGVIRRRDNGEIINYTFGLFDSQETMFAFCFAFQCDTCLYDEKTHIFEALEIGTYFNFIGQEFYTYQPSPFEIKLEQAPTRE